MKSFALIFFFLALSLLETEAFSPRAGRTTLLKGMGGRGRELVAMAAPAGTKHTLVLVRHGESTWNQENK